VHEQVTAAALEGAAARVWLVPLLPFLAFLIISFLTRPWGRVSAAVSILALTGSLGVSAQVFWQRFTQDGPPMQVALPWITLAPDHPLGTIELGLLVDNLSAMMLLMVCFVGLCIQIYSTAYIQTEIAHFPTQGSASMSRFFGWMSLFTFSMLGLVLSHNLLEIYIFWELVGVCSYLLIGFWYFKHSAAEACKKAFVVTRFGDLGFLMGILMLGVALKGFDFVGLSEKFTQGIPQGLTAGFVALAAVLIFCGAVGKSAQFPLQIWLPDAMEGPTPVSALIHAATMVAAGVYLVARLFPIFHPAGHAGEAALIVAWIGGMTAFLAATIAVVQNDIKRVLAYSTISQLGFMMAGLGMGAYTAGSFHLITHAFFKSLLFLGSGAVIVACHSNDLWRMGGLRRHMPFTWFAFLMGCLALAGVPPLAGFWSKDEILGYVHAAPGGMALYLVLTFSAFLTAFYVTRMYFLAFEGPYRGVEKAPADLAGPVPPLSLPAPFPTSQALDVAPEWTEEMAASSPADLPSACRGAGMEHVPHGSHPPHEVSPWMWGPLLVLAFFAMFLGFAGVPTGVGLGLPNFFEGFIHLSGEAHPHEFHWTPMVLSVVVALAGIALGAGLFAGDPERGERRLRSGLGPVWPFLQQKWYLDHLWARALAATMYAGARAMAWVEANLVDRAVFGLAGSVGSWGDWLRAEHTGKVQHYALMLLLALVLLAVGIGLVEPGFFTSRHFVINLLGGGR